MFIGYLVFAPILIAPVLYRIGQKNEEARDLLAILFAFVELLVSLSLFTMQGAKLSVPYVLAYGLSFEADGFRTAYSIVTSIMWAGTSLFSREYFRHEREGLSRYWMFIMLTLGATQGVMLSADLMTTFVFFEILSLTSFTWVIHEETQGAIRAAYTYLFIAVIGGLVLFMGLLLLRDTCGTLAFREVFEASERARAENASAGSRILAAGFCILFGFGAKAGMFPVHIWLPKAHPVAPSPASALLSGILTKVGIFGILMTGTTVLFESRTFGTVIFVLGLITMFLGALLALFSVNLKRTLACSSMSQIGFILVGIGSAVFINSVGGEEAGEGLALALSGTVLHMVNHSLLKLVLFMAAGVVVMNLHTLTLDEIRGWGRNKTALKIAFALGGLGISGIPLLNGYISKTMLHEGIVEAILCAREFMPGEQGMIAFLRIAEWIFLISGGFTFAYMLKLFICIFVERNRDDKRQEAYEKESTCMDTWSTAAICGSSVFMVLLGQPAVMKKLAFFMTGREAIMEFHAFTLTNLKGGLISLAIGGAVYLLIVRKVLLRDGAYVNLWPEKLDLEDLLYRPLLTSWLPGIFGAIAGVFGENLILRPVCRGVLFAASVFGRALSTSMDALIVLLRKTVVRETKVRTLQSEERRSRAAAFRDQTEAALNPIISGFSFALVMTCIGILLILGVLILYI